MLMEHQSLPLRLPGTIILAVIAGQLEIGASEKNIVQNCSFNGSITAQYDYAGGIVAYVASGATEITNCTSTGTLNGSGGYVGGILGGRCWGDNYC
ncbi:MAG: GLUG motif-containing protein [Bacillota bacterium]